MRILQILDHVGIYLVIAGSYTPFLMVALGRFTSANTLLIFEWLAAFFGAVWAGKQNLFSLSPFYLLISLLNIACVDLNDPSNLKFELSLMLGMGFGIVLVWDLLITELSRQALILLFLGAGCYLTGIIFFIMGIEYRPIYHAVWHIFVVVAATLHWFAIYFFVLQASGTEDSPTKLAVNDFVDSVSAAAEAINRTLSHIQQ